MKILFVVLLTLLHVNVTAQKKPSQSELQKEMERGLKELEDDDPEMAKKVRAMMKQQQPGKNAMNNIQDDDTVISWQKIPAKNIRKLSKLPTAVLSPDTLAFFIADINNQLRKKASAQVLKAAEKISAETEYDPISLSRSAVAAWYKNSVELSLLLAAKAAELSTSNVEILNTLSAILNLSGFGFKAIPVLQYLNAQGAKNSTVLNNLGQAYLSLGEHQHAEQYLLQCVAISNNHVEANKSLAILYKAKGQTAKAKAAVQKSLQGAYSETAMEIAIELGVSADETDQFLIHSVKSLQSPPYFNTYKYQIPLLCVSVQQASEVASNHNKFQIFLEAEIDKYEALEQEEEEKMKNNINQFVATAQSRQPVHLLISPMVEKGKRMFSYWLKEFGNFGLQMAPAYLKYSKEEHALNDAYHEEYSKINSLNANSNQCPAYDALANRYLPRFAANHQNYLDVLLTPYRGYINELTFWSQYYDLFGEGRTRFYGLIKGYLNTLRDLSRDTKIIFPACSPTPVLDHKPEQADTTKPFCPIKVVIPLGIVKVSFTCTQYELEAGEGLIVNYSGSFKRNSESTLAIGPGLPPLEIPGIDLGAKGQFYITFDGNNVPSDGGFKFEAGGEISLGPAQFESKMGFTLGLNSGWNFQSVSGDVSTDLLN